MKEWLTMDPAPPEEIARRKLAVETLLDEYEQAIKDAKDWYAAWKARQPKGFKAKRRRAAVSQ